MKGMVAQFAVAAAVLLPVAASGFVLGPTSPGKWGPGGFGTGATVTYSFMSSGVDCSAEGPGCMIDALGAFGPSFSVWKSEIEAAFDAWSAVADIKFVEVADQGEAVDGGQLSGDIRIGGHVLDGPGPAFGHGFYPPANGLSASGDLHFDSTDCWEAGFDGSADGCFSIFQVAAHEIGHIIGLGHTAVPGSLMEPFYTEAFSGPQADDEAGAVFIYGPAASSPGGGGGGGRVNESASLALVGLGLAGLGLATHARRRSRSGSVAQA